MNLREVRDKLSGIADMVSAKGNVFTARLGFFYTHGYDADKMAARIVAAIPGAKVIDKGEVWKPFRGGAGIAQQSHWWVRFEVPATSMMVSSELLKIAKSLMAEDEDAFKGYAVLLEYVAKKGTPILTAQDIHRDIPTTHNFDKKYHSSLKHLGFGFFSGNTEHGEFTFDGGGAMNHDGGISWTTLRADDNVLRDLGYDMHKVERALRELMEKAAPKEE